MTSGSSVVRIGAPVLAAGVAAAAGSGPLLDLDIGWHLVGGLWAIDEGAVPWTDPIGERGATWIAYSWLFEIAIAQIFVFGGFAGLQVAQMALVVCSAFVTLTVYRRLHGAPVSFRDGSLEVVAVGFAFLCLAPFWHLRPQIVSACLFSVFVLRAEERRLEPLTAFVLTVLWANVHVFWVLGPAIYWLYAICGWDRTLPALRRIFAQSAAIALAGLISPYGIWNFGPPIEYLLFHSTAYRYILEFQPLIEVRPMFVVVVAHTAWVLSAGRTLPRRAGWPLLILYSLSLCGALVQRKYLPFVGLTGMLLIARRLPSGDRESEGCFARIGAAALCSMILGIFLRSAPLPETWRDLLVAAQSTARSLPRDRVSTVLNNFNDGGWLALGLYLERPEGARASPVKCWVDGRTLVAGSERLAEISQLMGSKDERCAIIADPRFAATILRNTPGAPVAIERCGHPAEKLYAGPIFSVARRTAAPSR